MHALSILLVTIIGGTFTVLVMLAPFARENGRGIWRRCVQGAACVLMVVGAIGFFGSALAASGGLNWLPKSFEWPAGYCTGVITTPGGWNVVPHTPTGRIQVYTVEWHFVRGWSVDASGGTFKLVHDADENQDTISVITARGNKRYVYTLNGDLISSQEYSPASYSSFPDQGRSVMVPTAPWLWVFSSPATAWGAAASGMLILFLLQKTASVRKRSHRAEKSAGGGKS